MKEQFNRIKNLKIHYRNPKKILLFRIPTINYSSFDIKSQLRSGYRTYQPISITTLAANLIKRTDIDVKCVDLEFESVKLIFLRNRIGNILEELTKKYLLEFRPDIIGLSVVFSPGINNGYKVFLVDEYNTRKIKLYTRMKSLKGVNNHNAIRIPLPSQQLPIIFNFNEDTE